MADTLKVIIKRPGMAAAVSVIKNTLEDLQKFVGGYIETFTLPDGAVVIRDEEGFLKNKAVSCLMEGQYFFGPIIIAGVDGEEFADCPLTYKDAVEKWPFLLWKGTAL